MNSNGTLRVGLMSGMWPFRKMKRYIRTENGWVEEKTGKPIRESAGEDLDNMFCLPQEIGANR